MSQEDLSRFLRQLQTDEGLRREVAALAETKGFELTAEELGETDLDEIAGGPNRREHDHIGGMLPPDPSTPLPKP